MINRRWIKVIFLVVFAAMLSSCAQFHFWDSSYDDGAYGEAGSGQVSAPKDYLKADRRPPQVHKTRKGCVTAGGREYCGYDCKVVGNVAKCAKEPKQRCVVAPSGKIVCGYHCTSTHSGAKCGRYLYDNCVTNSLGEIKCGNNCREREDGELICGK